MRSSRLGIICALMCGVLGAGRLLAAPPAQGAAPNRTAAARLTLGDALSTGMRAAGEDSGAEAFDVTTGVMLYSHDAQVPRLPASVEKLYTSAAVLARFGAGARLSTRLLATGTRDGATLDGTLYLRGGGDPTFGTAAFDRRAYGTGATLGALAAQLRRLGIRRLRGRIIADASWFDPLKGTPATGGRPSIYVEGTLGGLTVNRGWADADGTVYFADPALAAGRAFVAALRAAGIAVPAQAEAQVRDGRTPAGATPLTAIASPPMAALLRLTDTPSDNFFAETLLKDLGVRFGAGGTTAAGAAVVRSVLASEYHIHAQLDDGSGLARYDRTSPSQVVSLLAALAHDTPFTNALAITGRTGTLRDENRASYAAGRCRGKTGTLHDVSNNVGLCRTQSGDVVAYAFLMNGVIPDAAHPIQNRMQTAIARYAG